MKLKATKKYLLIEEDQSTIKTLQNALFEFKNWNCIGVTNSLEMANSIVMKEYPDVIFIQVDNLFKDLEQVVSILRYNCKQEIKFVGISTVEEIAYELIRMNFNNLLISPLKRIEIKKLMLRFERNVT
ncbi:MAG TPA: hypothetical protein VIN72_08035 [Lutibacter sp.]